MHCGPFGNIAHGKLVRRRRQGRRQARRHLSSPREGSPPTSGWRSSSTSSAGSASSRPGAVVVVTTVRALKHHGEDPDGGLDAVERGAANLERHIGIVQRVRPRAHRRREPSPRGHGRGVRFRPATRARLRRLRRRAERGVREGRRRSNGARGGGRRRVSSSRTTSHYLYDLDAPIAEKIETIATRVYEAKA